MMQAVVDDAPLDWEARLALADEHEEQGSRLAELERFIAVTLSKNQDLKDRITKALDQSGIDQKQAENCCVMAIENYWMNETDNKTQRTKSAPGACGFFAFYCPDEEKVKFRCRSRIAYYNEHGEVTTR